MTEEFTPRPFDPTPSGPTVEPPNDHRSDYYAATGLDNDATGRRWERGDPVATGDFPDAAWLNFLEIGAIVPPEYELVDMTKPEDKVKNYLLGKLLPVDQILERAERRRAGEDVPAIEVLP